MFEEKAAESYVKRALIWEMEDEVQPLETEIPTPFVKNGL